VSSDLDLSVVIPAHNEGPNLRLLLPQLRVLLDELALRYEVLVVVREPDAETQQAAAGLARIVSQREPGYGGALRTGFSLAGGRHVLTMDADLSHPPTFAADLWRQRDSAEVLIASRYVPGGEARMPLSRALLSRVLNRFFALGLGVPLRDLSSGFRLYRRGAIGGDAVAARDFDVLPEIVIRAYRSGWRVREIPFRYEPRVHGSSNARIIPFGFAYLATFRRLFALRNSVVAADYEDRAFDSLIPLQRYWQRRRQRLVTELVADAPRVLDVGCGSSRILAALPEGSLGVDLLPGKLRRARRFERPLVRASALSLPFADGTWPCVVASQLVELLPRDSGLLEELLRVLAPGGRLVLATSDYGRWPWVLLSGLYSRLVPDAWTTPHRARYTREALVTALRAHGAPLEAARDILGSELVLAFRKA
jgi:dolichol-phosphate mannosyltransferase